MAVKAKKLPSGSWRCQVYAYTDDSGKRHYKSFTSTDPTTRGRDEAEAAAAAYKAENTKKRRMGIDQIGQLTVRELCEMYTQSRRDAGESPTTIAGYETVMRSGFPYLMEYRVRELDERVLQKEIRRESRRPKSKTAKSTGQAISAKTVRNEWGLISSALHRYYNRFNWNELDLPKLTKRQVELPEPEEIMQLVIGTPIELPVLLAMWLSFSLSEIRGLTRDSVSRDGDFITIRQVTVDAAGEVVTKDQGKTETRLRRHRIPKRIKALIEELPPDQDRLVTLSGQAVGARWRRLQERSADWDPITFHDLRHVNASVMAMLHVPDKYAQERGGWKTDRVMKSVYQNTFSRERVSVDNLVDNYFDEIYCDLQHEMQHE